MVQNLVPLCSYQYERVFNTTRIPGLESDRIQHLTDSPHIVIMHSGKFYKLTIHHKGRLLQVMNAMLCYLLCLECYTFENFLIQYLKY
jgi:hypothetical protein